MKPVLLLVVFMCTLQILSAQKVYNIKADSVKITNSCDTAELIIENHTQHVPGFLFNKGKGRTEFRRPVTKLNDSMYLVGIDTIKICCCANQNAWLLNGNSNGGLKTLGTIDNNDLPFITNNTERFRIAANGNVGIGTTNPAAKLHILGDIRAEGETGGASMFGYKASPGGTSYNYTTYLGISGPSVIRAVHKDFNWVSYATLAEYELNFRFGNGDDQGGGGISRPNVDGPNTIIYSNSNSNGRGGTINFNIDNVERMQISPTGLVGIGTQYPAYKLDVGGTARIQNSLYLAPNVTHYGPINNINDYSDFWLGYLNYTTGIRMYARPYHGFENRMEILSDMGTHSIKMITGNGDAGVGLKYAGLDLLIQGNGSYYNYSELVDRGITFTIANVPKARLDYTGALVLSSNNNVTTASPSAILDMRSDTKGFLPPRLTTAQRDAITSPEEGLMIYNKDLKKWQGYDGTAWVNFN
ncbi:MAG: hypothetical protein QM726_17720 [Chitinophagaceae bacterium]